jgi:hypothetical protein
MSTKPWKETTNFEKWAPKIGLGLIALIFTIMGFFSHQPCDIDKANLWCRLHPFGFLDFIGCAIFYFGCAWIGGFFKPVYNPENSSMWNWVTFAGLILGVLLIWVK